MAERVDFVWFNPDVGAFESHMCNAVIWPFEGGVAPEQWPPPGNTDKVKGQIYCIDSAPCGSNWVKAESVPG